MRSNYYKYRHNYSLRKWSRRGRAIGDFMSSLLVACLEHSFGVVASFIKWLSGLRCKTDVKQRKSNNEGGSDSTAAVGSAVQCFIPVQNGGLSDITFDDVVGLEEAKREIRLRLILPYKYPEKAKHYGIRKGGGLLLYGTPGTGKTMLARATANELKLPFYSIRPSDIVSFKVGESEKNIESLFKKLRKEKKAVLFIDEIEALIPSRKHNGSTIMQRIISTFLTEVDGFNKQSSDNTLFLMGATNEPAMIDPAMLRPGRFDCKIFVGSPDYEARKKLIEIELRGRPTVADFNLDEVAGASKGMTGAEIKELINKAADAAFEREIETGQTQYVNFSGGIKLNTVSDSTV